jgi:predicted permease
VIQDVHRDVRYAARGLWRDWPFTATTVATLAVALSLVTVVFAIFNAYVLRPYAVHDPWSLYEVRWQGPNEGGRVYAWQAYEALRDRSDLFDGVIAERHRPVIVDGRNRLAAFVSGNYFSTLQGRVRMGRPLTEADAAAPGTGAAAVMSFDAWDRVYDRDPAIVGRTISLNDRPFTVVGVMQTTFGGVNDTPPDFWVPVTMYPPVIGRDLFASGAAPEIAVIARLRAGITPAQAAAALGPSMSSLTGREGAVRAELLSQATPAPLSLELVAMLSPVFAAFVLVLVAACANVSNVMLARAFTRRREIGIRLSLGASRTRVVLQLFTEGLLIAGMAGVVGVLLSKVIVYSGTAIFFLSLPTSFAPVARVVPLDFDYRVFAFAFGVAGLTTLMFALVPALEGTRASLTSALRDDLGRGAAGSRLRSLLVIGQVTVSLVLIVTATTLARNSAAIQHVDPGYAVGTLVSIEQRAADPLPLPRVVEALAADPGIASLAVTSHNPLTGGAPRVPVLSPQTGMLVPTSVMHVSPEYFSTLDLPLLAGRGFTPDEAQVEAPVVIVSAAAAQNLWPNGSIIGQTIRIRIPADVSPGVTVRRDLVAAEDAAAQGRDFQVVGIARNAVVGLLYEGRETPHVYLPTSPAGRHARSVLARGRVPQDVTVAALAPVVRVLNPNPLTFDILPLTEAIALQRYPVMVASWIGLLLGAVAVMLSISGVYGVVTFGLNQRQKEIGIRMALGASRPAIVRLILLQSGRLVATGAAVGLLLSLSALGGLRAMIDLKNVSIVDPAAFAAGVVVIGIAAGVAGYLPSRRATRIDPASALRT